MPLTSFADAARTFEVIFAADQSAASGGQPAVLEIVNVNTIVARVWRCPGVLSFLFSHFVPLCRHVIVRLRICIRLKSERSSRS